MFRHIQISALAAALFVGYIVPLLLSVVVLMNIFTAIEQQDAATSRSLFGLMVVLNVLGSVAGGYVAAAVAKHQPLLHGLLSALLGVALISPFRSVGLLWALLFVIGGIVGAWLRK